MKIDISLFEKILSTIEKEQTEYKSIYSARDFFEKNLIGYDLDILIYHVALLTDLEYIKGESKIVYVDENLKDYLIIRMTYDGHVFLHEIRKEAELQKELDTQAELEAQAESEPLPCESCVDSDKIHST
jgi:phosphoribosyl 1,2-cyclic phosphodiesterase